GQPNRDRCASYRLLSYVPSRTTPRTYSLSALAAGFLAGAFLAAGFAAAASFFGSAFAFGALVSFASTGAAASAFGASSVLAAAFFAGALPSPTERIRSSVICWRCPALRR